ncbi:DUF192 domain-containing protein [Gloeobacter violaceus]|nr:DUF192 domain-containing protein [Gloeobacter violaceus]
MKPLQRRALWAGLALSLWTMPAPAQQAGQPQRLTVEAQVTFGKQTFKLEVARTVQQQAIGLMFRAQMPADRGMLFIFEPPRPAAFWMRNTLIPLDMVFAYRGTIVYIAADVPPCKVERCPTYGPQSGTDVDQVLEFNAGTASRLQLKTGDRVKIEFVGPGAFLNPQ